MNDISSTPIRWQPPEPRSGLLGQWDTFIGPGATRAELLLIWLSALGGAVFALAYAWRAGVQWSLWLWIIALIMAFDLFGGVVANATSTIKRWYFRPSQGFRQHITFVAYHIYPFLVAWLFRDGDWLYGLLAYGYLLLAAVLILRTQVYLKRPLAMLLYLVGITVPVLVLKPTPGLIWFLPVLYLKLLVCNLVPEAPFRPAASATKEIP